MVETASRSTSTAPACVDFEEFMKSDGEAIIRSIIARYGKGVDWEEAYQELQIELWRALCRYDPEKNVKVTTVVYRYVVNRMLMMQRRVHTNKHHFNQASQMGDDCLTHVMDASVDLEGDAEREAVCESRSRALYWAIRNTKLKDRERFVIMETLKETTQTQIGKMLGKEQSQVSRIKRSAMKKIRQTLMDAKWDGESIQLPDPQMECPES